MTIAIPQTPKQRAQAKGAGQKVPKEMDIRVGQRIRARRISIEMSQEKLGDALGLTFQQVQKYEKGTNRVGASRMAQIAEALGVSIGYLFGENVSAKVEADDSAIIQVMSNKQHQLVVNEYLKLSPALQNSFASLLIAMNKRGK